MRGVQLSDDEKHVIRDLHASGVSYSRIAMALNTTFALYNGGARTKHTIKSFVRSDSGMISWMVKVPRPLADLAKDNGIDISQDALSAILTDALRQRIIAGETCQ